MERTNSVLVPKFRVQDFDQREPINLKEKVSFTILFFGIFGGLGIGVYYAASWVYQLIDDLI
ncbi:MAG: hypothetical protein ACO1O6_04065 [Bacteroidota bacterium]